MTTSPWQVLFYVVPRRAFAAGLNVSSPATLDATDWFASAPLRADYAARVSAAAPASIATEAGLEVWGQQDGNRIEVRSADGRVRGITVRVDVRRLDSKFGAAIIDFIRKADAVLVRSDGLVVEPTIAAYAAALRHSEAWKYSSDPMPFLAAQAREDEEDDDDE